MNRETERIYLETRGSSLGASREFPVDILVSIDSEEYERMPYNEKYKVRAALSVINWMLPGKEKHALLFTPGKLGTPFLTGGIPAAFSEVSKFDAVFEFSDMKNGYVPEFGSRGLFFQTLMESEVLYTAVMEEGSTLCFEPDFMRRGENMLFQYVDEDPVLKKVIHVQELEKGKLILRYNTEAGHLTLAGEKIA